MRYIIQNILNPEVAQYHNHLTKLVSKKFDIHFSYSQDPHFTLKYIFEKDDDDLSELENTLESFIDKRHAYPITVGGFDHFVEDVYFLKVQMSPEAKQVFDELIDVLHTIDWLTWDQFDGHDMHFHSTIVHGCQGKFAEISEFLKDEEQVFATQFDNITILQNTGIVDGISNWEIYKKYLLK